MLHVIFRARRYGTAALRSVVPTDQYRKKRPPPRRRRRRVTRGSPISRLFFLGCFGRSVAKRRGGGIRIFGGPPTANGDLDALASERARRATGARPIKICGKMIRDGLMNFGPALSLSLSVRPYLGQVRGM